MTTPIDAQTDPLTQSYQQYHRELSIKLCDHIKNTPPFNVVNNIEQDSNEEVFSGAEVPAVSDVIAKPDNINSGEPRQLQEIVLEKLNLLADTSSSHQDLAETGQWLISTIIGAYPHITPHIPRDLFWYFGGDCLHFLGDEEISHFQAIDEAIYLARTAEHAPQQYEQILRQIAGQSHNMH